jgi:5-oxoprolinase (ATP-hydrolysing)
MTNSRLTDPEVLEMRFPVLLEDFHIRQGRNEVPSSSRDGRSRAEAMRRAGSVQAAMDVFLPGTGTMRTVRFLEKMDCAFSPHIAPFPRPASSAAHPANSALPGSGVPTATVEELEGADQTVLEPGDAVIRQNTDRGGYGLFEETYEFLRVFLGWTSLSLRD